MLTSPAETLTFYLLCSRASNGMCLKVFCAITSFIVVSGISPLSDVMKKSLVAELFGLTSNLEENPKSFLNSRRNFLPNPQYIKRLTEELRVTKRLEIWKKSLAQLHSNLIFHQWDKYYSEVFCTCSENHSTLSIDSLPIYFSVKCSNFLAYFY